MNAWRRVAMRAGLAAVMSLSSAGCLAAESAAPAWFIAEIARLSQGSGRWIADNTPHRSETEPFDAYGVEWRPTADKRGVTGRLFGLADDREVAQFWTFDLQWDEGRGAVVATQVGVGGAQGHGRLVGFGDATLMEQTFTVPGGRTWRELHHSWFEGEVHITRAYDWVDGGWKPGRTYRWQLTASTR